MDALQPEQARQVLAFLTEPEAVRRAKTCHPRATFEGISEDLRMIIMCKAPYWVDAKALAASSSALLAAVKDFLRVSRPAGQHPAPPAERDS